MWETDSRWVTITVITTIATAVILGLGARPAYRAVKAWRARSLAAHSDALRAQGKLPEAQLRA